MMTKEQFDAEMRPRMIDAYSRIAKGEWTKDEAVAALGYKSWTQMDQVRNRRGLLSLARLTLKTAKHISNDDIMDAMDRINAGEDPDAVAIKAGFRDFEHLNATRACRRMPSLRELRGGYGATTDMESYRMLVDSTVDKAVRHQIPWDRVLDMFARNSMEAMYDMLRNLGLKNVTERRRAYKRERLAEKKNDLPGE